MQKNILGLILTMLLVFASPAFANKVSGVITMDFDLSAQPAGQEVKLWLPYPVTDGDQDITGVKLEGDYTEAAVYTDRVFGTPVLYARWDKTATDRQLSLSFTAARHEVARRNFPAQEAAWDPADYALYLAPTSLAPFTEQITKLAAEITKGQTGVLAKARAVYDWTVDNTYRKPETRGCGKGDVCLLLQDPGGKCADISSVYIALARAAGVPAREVFGIRMGKDMSQDISTWQHCWAEFYLPGYGWVPVDPADVRKKMLVEKLELNEARTREYREYFWGGVDAYRLRLSEGRDLTLNPPQAGEPLNYLMYPFAQVGDATLDWLDPATFKYTLLYHQMRDGHGLVDTEGLKKMLDGKATLTVIDARNPEEYQEVHIKGAISIPVKQWDKFAGQLPAEKSARLVFYCNGSKCGKSKKAAARAIAAGYDNVFIYAEGMPVWEEKGLPIYAGPDYEKRIETTKIAPAELQSLINSGATNLTVVDVRDPEEFQAGHIPDAINIPVAGFAAGSEVLDKEKQIVVYCNSGGRSYNAYRKLQKLGYEKINQAIFADWREAGLPVEK
ncbi:MAG: hypothetical protein KKG35_10530 [Proteobacteria bacterium]|nr:hypothetical protein [Pseudomonadota bacterium]